MKPVVAFVFSLLALLGSGAAALWVFQATHTQRPLSDYDLGSPAAALHSEWQMMSEGNFPAQLELSARRDAKENQQRMQSLKVVRDMDYDGKKLLFISTEVKGKTEREVRACTRDASGRWFPAYFSVYSLPPEASAVKESVEAWQRDGTIK